MKIFKCDIKHKNNTLWLNHSKLLFSLIAIGLFYLLSIMIFLNLDLIWFFKTTNSIDNHKTWFPNYWIITFFALKILPIFILLFIIMASASNALSDRYNALSYIISKYKISDKNLLSVLILAFSALVLFFNMNESNFFYLLPSIVAILLMIPIIYLSTNNQWIDLTYLVFVAIICRISFLEIAGTFDFSEEGLGRVAQVYLWQNYGGMPGAFLWLPAHHLCIYLLSKLFFISFEESGVLLNLISGIGIIPIGYFLTKSLFNTKTAFLSMLFISINPWFIKFSVNQMSEMPFLFFVLVGIYFGFRFFETNKALYFFLSVVGFNISNMIRFESWIILFLFALVFFLNSYNLKRVFIWGLAASLSAFLYAALSYINFGDLIYGVTASDDEVKLTLDGAIWQESFKNLITNLWFPIYFLPLFILGAGYCFYKKRNVFLVGFILLLTSYYVYKICSLTLMPFGRYLAFVTVFWVIFMFYFLSRKVNKFLLVSIFVLVFTIDNLSTASSINKMISKPKSGYFESALYFKENLLNKKDTKIILSMNPFSEFVLWGVYSGFSENTIVFHREHPGTENRFYNLRFNVENLSYLIQEENFNVIFVEEGYEIDSLFEQESLADYLANKQLDTIAFGQFKYYIVN